jgi:hypothetical protein
MLFESVVFCGKGAFGLFPIFRFLFLLCAADACWWAEQRLSILSELSEALSEHEEGSSMGEDMSGGTDQAGVLAGRGVIRTSDEPAES